MVSRIIFLNIIKKIFQKPLDKLPSANYNENVVSKG